VLLPPIRRWVGLLLLCHVGQACSRQACSGARESAGTVRPRLPRHARARPSQTPPLAPPASPPECPGAKTVRKKKVGRRLIALIQALPSVQWVAQHPANVSALPFDGIVMLSDPPRNSDSDFSFMTQRNVSLNAAALKLQLDQLRGLELGSATDNFVLVHATPAGSFASYVEPGKVATNFGLLAAAASAAGLTGIFFDVECYLVRTRHLCQCGRRPDTRVACSICGQSSVPGSCSHHSAFHLV
jgi:hypothetical protein